MLRACLQHEPDSVDSFWAAATVEGSVSLDPGDVSPPLPASSRGIGATTGVRDDLQGKRDGFAKHASISEDLTRVLGFSYLDVEDGDLGELSHG